MGKIKIQIGSKQYNVKLAKTEKEKRDGLKDIESLPKDEGMLFIFEEPEELSFWMEDTSIPLDIVFIDDDLSVISIKEGIPYSKEFITEKNVTFVLEVNKNSGIKIGDELEFSPNSKLNVEKMLVLDPKGNIQMELEGGERIFSRANTKTLIKFAKKAYYTQKDSDFKALGKRVFKFLQIQNNNEPEYVSKKEETKSDKNE